MKKDIMVFLGEFHRNNSLTKSLNSTFITLIPKVDNPMGLTDFRPISLIGIVYKILSKVLASRIKMTIPVVVGEVQSAFSGGKNIQDGILIANEVVEEWKRCRKRGLIIKLDFEKAFDKLNWNYLLKIMERMGFPSKWREWVQECLSSARVSVLINGSPCDEFEMHKGVRQGDPLSPFLFIIAAEGLNWMIKKAEADGLVSGMPMGIDGPVITHLQFADDTLVFCLPKLEEVSTIKWLLIEFEAMSGLKINFQKTVMCGIGIEMTELQPLANVLNCQIQKLPIKYLGLPLGANPRLKSTWKPIIEKIKA